MVRAGQATGRRTWRGAEACRADLVQDLRQIRIHASALAGGQDDQRDCILPLSFPFCAVLRAAAGRAKRPAFHRGLRDVAGPEMRGCSIWTARLPIPRTTCWQRLTPVSGRWGRADVLGPQDRLTAFHGGRAMLRLGLHRLGRAMRPRWTAVQAVAGGLCGAIDVHTRMYPAPCSRGSPENERFCRIGLHQQAGGSGRNAAAAAGVRDLFGAMVGADTFPVRKPDRCRTAPR